MELTENLKIELRQAANTCFEEGKEEEGGFILKKGDDFHFIKVWNANRGNPIAVALYTADREYFGKVVVPFFSKGWELWGSFHSHPGTSVAPSGTDINRLFRGHPNNFIYSPKSKRMVWYKYTPDIGNGQSGWLASEVKYNE